MIPKVQNRQKNPRKNSCQTLLRANFVTIPFLLGTRIMAIVEYVVLEKKKKYNSCTYSMCPRASSTK